MKRILFNVAGNPGGDIPTITTDDPRTFPGVFESANRCILDLPDDANGGGTLRWGPHAERVLLPLPRATPYEADELGWPPLIYGGGGGSGLLRLRTNGTRFETDDGARWFGLTATDFLLFNRLLRGEDPSDVVAQRKAAGINEHRVTLLMQFIPSLNGWPVLRPETYAEYWTVLPQFVDWMADRGQRVKLTGMCDMQHISRDVRYQQEFIARVVDTLRTRTNWRLEAGNEWEVNAWHPNDVQRHSEALMSRGSSSIDHRAFAPGFDWHEYHRRRSDYKFANADDLAYTARHGGEEQGDTPRPVDDGEPIGFDETYQPARRENTPEAARAVRYSAEAFAAATCFHSTRGLGSERWGPITEACALAFCGEVNE